MQYAVLHWEKVFNKTCCLIVITSPKIEISVDSQLMTKQLITTMGTECSDLENAIKEISKITRGEVEVNNGENLKKYYDQYAAQVSVFLSSKKITFSKTICC